MLEFFKLCDSGIIQCTFFNSAAGNPNFCLSLSVLNYAFGNTIQYDTFYFCFTAPMAPEIIPDECTVTNNAIKLSWKPRKQSCVDGYVVEVDDGTSSGKEDNFLQVYRGDNLECTISGLQFNSTYRARVKGFNKAGEGAPSDEVYLTTSDSKQTI